MHIRTKRIMLGIGTLAAISAGYYVWSLASQPVVLPERFGVARSDAAAASEEVVRLADEVRRLVGEVNAAEKVGEHETALARVAEAKEKNEAARQAALTLTNRLQALTESLGEILSTKSQGLAFEAIAAQLAVADEYLTYTGALNTFFDAISSDGAGEARRAAIQSALDAVNQSATRIGELNTAALSALSALENSL